MYLNKESRCSDPGQNRVPAKYKSEALHLAPPCWVVRERGNERKRKGKHKLTGLTNECGINGIDINSKFRFVESLSHARGHWVAFHLIKAICEALPPLCSVPVCNSPSGITAMGFRFYSHGDKY